MMNTRFLSIAFACLLATVGFQSTTEAKRPRGPRQPLPPSKPLAEPSVRDVISTQIGPRIWRGIVSIDSYQHPALTIDLVMMSRRPGAPAQFQTQTQVHLLSTPGGSLITMGNDVQDIRMKRWNGNNLIFTVKMRQGDLKCESSLRGQQWQAHCSWSHAGATSRLPPPLPPLPLARKNRSTDIATIQACGKTFDGSANEIACLDALAHVPYPPIAIIGACDRSMDGDANELECIKIASKTHRDPSRILSICERVMDGDANELKCMKIALRAVFDPIASINACGAAMDGDVNELKCIKLISNGRQDHSALVRTCDQSMSGDEAELACIARVTRR